MSEKRFDIAAMLPFILSGIAALMGLSLLALAAYFLLRPPPAAPVEPTLTPTVTRTPVEEPATSEAAVDTPTNTAEAVETPTEAPATEEPATDTPRPTSAPPTNAPPPSNTPRPTDTPPPSATATPATGRVINPAFSVENPSVGVNERIWFNFSVTNPSQTEKLPFGYLGAAVFLNGQNVFFQGSWSGADLQPGQTLNWRDGLAIGTPGSYQLQLSICYSAKGVCDSGGDWVLLAQPVTVTVQ